MNQPGILSQVCFGGIFFPATAEFALMNLAVGESILLPVR
jgi:hypothetical protein